MGLRHRILVAIPSGGPRKLAIAAAAALVGSAVVAAAAIAVGASLQADDQAVRNTVVAAIHAQQETSLPPSNYAGGPMSAAMKSDMAARGADEFAKYFTGPELAKREQVLQANTEEQASGQIRYLAAGVTGIELTKVTIANDRADVSATGNVWADLAQVQPAGKLAVAHPTNTILYTLSLEKVNGAWHVVAESMNFAPGSEP